MPIVIISAAPTNLKYGELAPSIVHQFVFTHQDAATADLEIRLVDLPPYIFTTSIDLSERDAQRIRRRYCHKRKAKPWKFGSRPWRIK